MPISVTWVGNEYDHLSHLVFCDRTGRAAAIDPYHVDLTLETAKNAGLDITYIINTHEHWDHAGRNERMREATGATVLAPRAAAGVIETVDRMLIDGDTVTIGDGCTLTVLATPGHTMTHISLLGDAEGTPFLMCGDTLFGGGVGNCGFGGHAPTLFETIERLGATLTPETLLYPGHDYLARNLAFTLHHEPDNRAAADLLEEIRDTPRLTSIADERAVNPFFRLDSPSLRAHLVDAGAIAPDAARQDVFLALRAARDSW